mmetsp:Transcript_29549/g.46408  ORF Transcript_29549/g.46408 Transcript_29549/m.46408 type:complete len:157 (-) Transcript_29549:356-826(-)
MSRELNTILNHCDLHLQFIIPKVKVVAFTTSRIHHSHQRIRDILDLLAFSETFLHLNVTNHHPIKGVVNYIQEILLVLRSNVVLRIIAFNCSLQGVNIRFEPVSAINFLFHQPILLSKFLCFLHHALNLFVREATSLGSNGDLFSLSGSFVLSGHL